MYVYQVTSRDKLIKYLELKGIIFISRYKNSHVNARKIALKMFKEGLLIKLDSNSSGFTYKLSEHESCKN